MDSPTTIFDERHEELTRHWTDQYVQVSGDRPELKRFAGIIGRVVTVNWNNQAIVDFQDGAWYDIAPDFLTIVPAADAKAKFNSTMNSAQAYPERQG